MVSPFNVLAPARNIDVYLYINPRGGFVMSQYARDVNEAAFDDEILQSSQPVLVDFWAPWCAPCRAMTGAVEAVAQEYGDRARVLKLNVDESPTMSPRYNIRGIPTLILFKDGQEAGRLVGLQSKEQISGLIEKILTGAGS
jgi:thioredoxin 1